MRLPPSLAVCIIYYNYTTRRSTKQIDAYQEFFYELRGTSSRSSLLSDLRSLPCLECPVGGIIGVGLLLFGAADGLRKRLSGRRSLCRSQMSNSWSRPRWCLTLTGTGSTPGRDSILTPTSVFSI